MSNQIALQIKCKLNTYTVTFSQYNKPLGMGAFSKVYQCSDKTGKIFAVKEVIKSPRTPKERYQEEIKIMEKYSECANIVHIIDYFEDPKLLYIVMPSFDKGTLLQFVNSNQIASELEAIEYFRQICYGVQALHANKTIHRDIKMENIFVCGYHSDAYPLHNYLTIGDFGLSREMDINMSKYVGTPLTQAPEVKTNKYTSKADIYSLGCVLHFMITKHYPFEAQTVTELQKLQIVDKITVHCNTFKISKFTLAILEGCLQFPAENRMSTQELCEILDIGNLYKRYASLHDKLGEQDTHYVLDLKKRERTLQIAPNQMIKSNIGSKVSTLYKSPTIMVPHKSNPVIKILRKKCSIPILEHHEILKFVFCFVNICMVEGVEGGLEKVAQNYSRLLYKESVIEVPLLEWKTIGIIIYYLLTGEVANIKYPIACIPIKNSLLMKEYILLAYIIENVVNKDNETPHTIYDLVSVYYDKGAIPEMVMKLYTNANGDLIAAINKPS